MIRTGSQNRAWMTTAGPRLGNADSQASVLRRFELPDALMPRPGKPATLPDAGGPTTAQLPGSSNQTASRADGSNQLRIPPFISLAASPNAPRRIDVLQQWEGVVSSIEGDTFWAEMSDLTDPDRPQEIIELPLTEISPSDMELFVAGAVFYWTIGYEQSATGQIRRVSELRAKRSPRWSQFDIRAIDREADELFKRLANDDQGATA
jgi:hypothetical protein